MLLLQRVQETLIGDLMMRYFEFYLSAWNFCHQNKLDHARIVRKSWKQWGIELTDDEEKYVPV